MSSLARSLCLALVLGCAAERPLDDTRPTASAARTRAEALDRRLRDHPDDGSARVERAELAAFLDRDDARAQTLLEGLPAGAHALDAALLGCELAAAHRDYPQLLARCAGVVQLVPASPQAELAAGQLLLAMDQTRGGDAVVEASLRQARARCAVAPGATACVGIALASARASLTTAAQRKDAAAYRAALDAVAAVRAWRVCPRLAPDSVEHFRQARAALGSGDVDDPACRARRTEEPGLRVGTYDPLAVTVVESWVRVPSAGVVALLWQLPDAARALVDEVVVVDRDPWLRRAPDSSLVHLHLAPGWHHLRVVTWPRGMDESVSLWGVGGRGEPAFDAWQAAPPSTTARARARLAEPIPMATSWLQRELDPAREPWRAVRLISAWTGDLLDDGERARQLAQRLVTLEPDSAAAWFALAEAVRSDPTLPETTRQTETRRALSAVLEHRPGHLIASYRLALLDVDERPEQATERMRALVAAHPDYPWAQRRLHAMLGEQGLAVAAAAALERALLLAPGDTTLGDAQGFYRRQGAVVQARAAQQARLDLGSSLFSTRRAEALLAQGELPQALRAYDAAYALAPDQPGFDAVLRLALQVEGWVGVRRRAEQRLETFPLDLLATRWLVRAARHDGELEATLARAERIRPGLPEWLQRRERALGQDLDRHLPVDTAAILREFAAQAAARPELYQGHAYVYVLDAAARVYTALGGGARITHQLLWIQGKDAASQLGEVRPPAGAELRALRVHKPDGRMVEPEAAHQSGEVSLSGVEIGDVIELRWIEELHPDSVDGSSHARFFFASQVPVYRSLFVLAGPARELDALALGGDGAPAPQRSDDGEQRRLLFEARDVPAQRPQPHAPSPLETLPHLTVTRGVDAALHARRAARRLAETEEASRDLASFARGAVRGVRGDDERLRALVHAVVQRVRDPGPEQSPVAILATGRGDRQALLRAAGREVGLDLRWVALHRASPLPAEDWPDAALDERLLIARLAGRELPLVLSGHSVLIGAVFAHARGGSWVEVDPAAEHARGVGTLHAVPEAWLLDVPASLELDAELQADGTLRGSFVMSLQPPLAGFLRQRLRGINPDDTARAIEGWFGQLVPGAALSDFTLDALDDDLQPLGLRARFVATSYALLRGDALIVARFLPQLSLVLGGEGVAPASYLRVAQRTVPIVIAPHRERSRVTLRLPAGLRPRALPAILDEDGTLGRYQQQVRISDGTLEVVREFAVPATRVAVEQGPALRALAQRIEAGVSTQLVLEPARAQP